MSGIDTPINPELFLNEIYCITEAAWQYSYGKDPLTVCPNNATHTVDSGSSQQAYSVTPLTQIVPYAKSSYYTGTASHSGTTVTGTGTTFTSSMVGGLICYPSGKVSVIDGFTSTTSLTTLDSFTEADGSYTIYYGGFQTDINGYISGNTLRLQNTTDQIKLGTGSAITTLSAVAPSSKQTLTLIDSGSSTANIILSQGTQTLSGKYTFNSTGSDALNLGRATGSISFNPGVSTGTVTANGNSGVISVTTITSVVVPSTSTGYFTVNNSVVSSNSVVVISISDYSALVTPTSLSAYVSNITSGSFRVSFYYIGPVLTNLPTGSTWKVHFIVA